MQRIPTDPRLPRSYHDEETFESIFETHQPSYPYHNDHCCRQDENHSRQQFEIDNDEDDSIVYESSGIFARRDIPPRPPTPPHTHFSISDSAMDRIPVLDVGHSAPSSLLSSVVKRTLPFLNASKCTDVQALENACVLAHAHRNLFVPDMKRMHFTEEAQQTHETAVQYLLDKRRSLQLAGALERLHAFSVCLATLQDDVATVATVGCTLASIESDTPPNTSSAPLNNRRRAAKRKFSDEQQEQSNKRRS